MVLCFPRKLELGNRNSDSNEEHLPDLTSVSMLSEATSPQVLSLGWN